MCIQNYSDKIRKATELINNADYVVIGAGAGLSAAGGLNYGDPELFKRWFPWLSKLGVETIAEACSVYWGANDSNRTSYWGYWASHIKNIRYNTPVTKPYLDLFEIVKDKNYFIITTNVDGQFEKAGFSKDIIFAPQGDYGLFQCEKPCCNEVFDNKDMIDKMVLNIDYETFSIRGEDIPICPKCGGYMSRNLRVDDTFVETPHLVKQKDYAEFINSSAKGKLVLIELGVGFNTPSIIRWPFDGITARHSNASLIRINMDYPEIPKAIMPKGLGFDNDIASVIADIRMNKL